MVISFDKLQESLQFHLDGRPKLADIDKFALSGPSSTLQRHYIVVSFQGR